MTGKRSRLWLVITLMAVAVLLWTTRTPATALADTPGGKSPEGVAAIIQPPLANPNAPQLWSLTENFDVVAPPGWTVNNQSVPAGNNWFQGNPAVFPAQSGATNSYAGANFQGTTGANTISNWFYSPLLTINNGDTWSFWTRKATPAPTDFPDRLQVRISTNGACSPGTGNTSTGDFSTLLLDINPTLVVGGYPVNWTNFNGTISGLGAPATGCFAFRYFVTNGGPSGANSDYIGVDTLVLAAGTGATPTATATATPTTPASTATATATATPTTPASTATATATATPTTPGSTATATATPGGTGGRYCSTTPIPIPDNSSGSGTIVVPDAFTISDLNIIVTGTHTWVGDVTLTINNGTTGTAFFDRPGVPASTFGCSGDDFPGVFADDEGTDGAFETACQDATPAYTPGGRYTPNSPLSVYDGGSSAGTWTLTAADAAAPDTGTITSWCLDFNAAGGPTPTATATATVPGPVPDINVTPNAFTETHNSPPQTTTDTMNIQNVGAALLTWTIVEDDTATTPVQDITDKVSPAPRDARLATANAGVVQTRFLQSGAMVPSLFGGINLVLDDGTPENGIGLTNGGELIWFNRFTPAPTDYPFTLNTIQLYTGSDSLCSATDTVDFYVYQDADSNPANGATFVSGLTGQTLGTLDQFNSYPVSINLTGPGDVLILAVNRTCDLAGQFPASIDQTASQMRSWIGFYGGTVPNPPTLPAPQLYDIIDNFGLPGNWMIRGEGSQGGGACSAPTDIPWLTVSPNAGSTAGGGSTPVTLTYNSASLANGTYTGTLCIASNDPDEALVTVPITLNVGPPTAIDLTSFTSPVAGVNLGDLAAAGLLLLAGAVLVLRRK